MTGLPTIDVYERVSVRRYDDKKWPEKSKNAKIIVCFGKQYNNYFMDMFARDWSELDAFEKQYESKSCDNIVVLENNGRVLIVCAHPGAKRRYWRTDELLQIILAKKKELNIN